MQDHTALEMAKFKNETVRGGGEVIDLKRVRNRDLGFYFGGRRNRAVPRRTGIEHAE
jgi:hypothetical protein